MVLVLPRGHPIEKIIKAALPEARSHPTKSKALHCFKTVLTAELYALHSICKQQPPFREDRLDTVLRKIRLQSLNESSCEGRTKSMVFLQTCFHERSHLRHVLSTYKSHSIRSVSDLSQR